MDGITNFIRTLVFAWQKPVLLRRISRKLGNRKLGQCARSVPELRNRLHFGEERLFDLIERDAKLARMLTKHHVQRDMLRYLYEGLQRSGAGRWARGHWIPASALTYGVPLKFLLSRSQQHGWSLDESTWCNIADRIVAYYRRGGGGYI